ncbi:hypothetical protein PCASD_12596 [Puccinia coronata f. sp. avenae]|uniref:Uncharacterized protein n=1 Tax=Puccinia coronata f. sp. avenae TaxID=200324 RepID=A0A2N5ULX4_9BASI|nr:hypothetical protein PCASD_12596 [Puccinia coronata f. sp. avenae]
MPHKKMVGIFFGFAYNPNRPRFNGPTHDEVTEINQFVMPNAKRAKPKSEIEVEKVIGKEGGCPPVLAGKADLPKLSLALHSHQCSEMLLRCLHRLRAFICILQLRRTDERGVIGQPIAPPSSVEILFGRGGLGSSHVHSATSSTISGPGNV